MNSLETQVLELIGEDTSSPDVFTDTSTGMAPIRDSLNDAIQEITLVTGSYKRHYYIPLRSSKTFYRMRFRDDHFGWITDAWLVNQKRRLEQTDLIRLNQFNPRWMENTGSPEGYLQIGQDVFGTWPTSSADNDLVDLTCVMVPNRYTEDTDRIKIRTEFQTAAVHYALSEFYAGRGDAKTAIYHWDLYLEKLGIQKEYPVAAERLPSFNTNKEPWPTSTD